VNPHRDSEHGADHVARGMETLSADAKFLQLRPRRLFIARIFLSIVRGLLISLERPPNARQRKYPDDASVTFLILDDRATVSPHAHERTAYCYLLFISRARVQKGA